MAQRSLKAIISAMITMTLLWMIASSSQPEDCTGEVISLSPCIDYITGAASAPSGPCCSQLAAVVRSEPTCFCRVLKGGGPQFGIAGLNRTLALALPAACHIDAPTVGKCNEVAGAAPAPPPNVSPPGGGNSNGGDSAGSFVRPTVFPVVVSIVIFQTACHSIPSMIF